MDITIEKLQIGSQPKIALVCPYNADLLPRARELGGEWDKSRKAWLFDARDEERVRELVRSLFGTDTSSELASDLVTVRVPLRQFEVDNSAVFAGRKIAVRPTRDERVRLSSGVVLVQGSLFNYGGSGKYPRIDADDNVIVEIRDIPRSSLSVVADGSYEIVDQTIDRDALSAERARLLARITEIDTILGKDNS